MTTSKAGAGQTADAVRPAPAPAASHAPIGPGGTIGILGGGQLARMMAAEARRMGYRIGILDPNPEAPSAAFANRCFTGAFDDEDAALALAEYSDVLTLDTEHIPATLLAKLEEVTPVRPSSKVLGIVQDRSSQRRFLAELGVPQVPNAPVDDAASLHAAAEHTGVPAVLKTRTSGYDGKGQARVNAEAELADAWRSIGETPAVMESFIEYEREVSVLFARDLAGNLRFYPVPENDHRNHILHTSRVPARITDAQRVQAEEIGATIAAALDYVGVMAVELFVTADGLLVNEIAPRTHNSGHYTLGACATSQFEQHVRAICGLPLGDPGLLRPAVMLNVLGDSWRNGPPNWSAVDAHPTAKLHLYDKAQPSKGRKMGHVLVLGGEGVDPVAIADELADELG